MFELVGFILPPFIDFLNKYVENSKLRFVVSMLVSVVAAGVISLYEGKLNLNSVPELLTSAGVVFAEAQIVYKLLYDQSSLQRAIR